VRIFSISAGLLASTVTPGSTAPDVSRTTPAIALCACTVPGIQNRAPTLSNRKSFPPRALLICLLRGHPSPAARFAHLTPIPHRAGYDEINRRD
jgi:hypothetical protein